MIGFPTLMTESAPARRDAMSDQALAHPQRSPTTTERLPPSEHAETEAQHAKVMTARLRQLGIDPDDLRD